MSVKKILNNGNFIAHLAPVLAGKSCADSEINAAADLLSTAANTYRSMLADLGITVQLRDEWEGCDQAKALIRWINGGPDPDAVAKMGEWADDIWTAISELADGKLPS